MSQAAFRLVVAGVVTCVLPLAATAATVTFYTSEAAFIAAASPTLIETFEGVFPKDTALPTLNSNGITYTPFAGSPTPNIWVASPGYTNFGAGVGTTTTSVLVANGDEDFVGAFATPYYAVGFDAYLNGLGPASASFFNGATLLGSFAFDPSWNDIRYIGIISDTPITSFRWTTTLGGQLNTGIDNISVSNVPEPATLLLLGSGLMALARRRRE